LSDFFPEPDSKAVNESGNILDKEKFTEMLKGYYKLRGWNEQSGQLKPEPLSSLGMDDIVAQLRGYKG
jgi:aldehyde:ferredoxin oxidoreductase